MSKNSTIDPSLLQSGDTIWVEHTVKKVIENKSVSTNGGTFKVSKIKKHIPLDRTFKVGDKVEIIGEHQPEWYDIISFTTDGKEAVLNWFGSFYGVHPTSVLKKVK